MTENEELQKVIDEYKEFMRQEKLSLELSNYSEPLRKTIEENIRDIGLEINWLEEIQQYRAIGTVEELKSLKESNLTALEMADMWCLLEDLKKYSAIGTIEEFKALKEKNEPKKIRYIHGNYDCNSCGKPAMAVSARKKDYCDFCGQKLDWSE